MPESAEWEKSLRSLFSSAGTADYIGEEVSIVQHSLQAAYLALTNGAERLAEQFAANSGCARLQGMLEGRTAESEECSKEEFIAACLLHDVGHMLGIEGRLPQMDGWGTEDHEGVGARWAGSLGFTLAVCDLIHNHVNAKRYLCYVHPVYQASLTTASQETLVRQGGPMNEEEATEWEKSPRFLHYLAIRRVDEEAKVPNMEVPDLSAYLSTLQSCMNSTHTIA
eukprot:CAMPEP_0113895760 /NCGR_PEP_ID=MMETSP0780_2-20120614/17571_1 /TAXON_ID=652834 /ORGANISM="Palpitomonas bilix" /LENGTH=223 /DNA_ID=CAMNT_0000886685 /DNA_START=45 /DNA_END=716 /DNA_ORIENTATION=- /assembly_acc=CAM_ASM_000599